MNGEAGAFLWGGDTGILGESSATRKLSEPLLGNRQLVKHLYFTR